MKKTLLLAALLLACSVASATAVWDIQLDAVHNPADMSFIGTFTTAGADFTTPQLITSISGTFTDAANLSGASVSLVPTNSPIQGSAFDFDNKFFDGPTVDAHGNPTGTSLVDVFDLDGLVFKAGTSYINFYVQGTTLYSWDNQLGVAVESGSSFAPPGHVGDYIKFDHFATSVDEPIVPALMAMGLAITILRSRRKIKG